MYVVNAGWCPPLVQIKVEHDMHLSDHFPLSIQCCAYEWFQKMKGCTNNRPLMVNHVVAQSSLFAQYVISNIEFIKAMSCSVVHKWILFVQSMQHGIRTCGKS